MKELGEDLKNNAWLKMSEEEIQAAYLLLTIILIFLIGLKRSGRPWIMYAD